MSRLKDAINILLELRIAENIPEFYKPVITKIINTLINDVQEEQHGHWVSRIKIYECSECGFAGYPEMNYCPWCGAKMDAKGEDDAD